MHVTADTQPGSPTRDNEDWIGCTPRLTVVLDGATVRTDTGCVHDVSWYVRHLGGALLTAAATPQMPLTEGLASAISSVRGLHETECDLSHPGTPSAAVDIVRHDGESLDWLVLGDVTVALDLGDGDVQVHSDQRISASALDERSAADRLPIGHPDKPALLRSMKVVELAARNRVDGYWIAAADPAAATHALTGAVSNGWRRVAVLTDGAARAVDLFRAYTWSRLLDVLSVDGPEHLIRHIRQMETGDPVGIRFPRNKVSDDASVVLRRPSRVFGEPVNAGVVRREPDSRIFRSAASGHLLGAAPCRDGHIR